MRQRQEHRHDEDDERPDDDEPDLGGPARDHLDDRHNRDDDEGRDEQAKDRAVEALRLVIANHRPLHIGFRRSMKALTPSRKSALV